MTVRRAFEGRAVGNRAQRAFALVGPPGSGKGTQSAWLTDALGLTALSTGELARDASRGTSDNASLVAAYMSSGSLLPDSIVFDLVRAGIVAMPATSRGLLFDGFPRTETQAVFLEEQVLTRPLDVFIELCVDEEMLLERLASRGRDDDHEASVLRRLDDFNRRTRPMIDRVRGEGRVISVDGAQPPALVHRAIVQELGWYLRSRRELSSS